MIEIQMAVGRKPQTYHLHLNRHRAKAIPYSGCIESLLDRRFAPQTTLFLSPTSSPKATVTSLLVLSVFIIIGAIIEVSMQPPGRYLKC